MRRQHEAAPHIGRRLRRGGTGARQQRRDNTPCPAAGPHAPSCSTRSPWLQAVVKPRGCRSLRRWRCATQAGVSRRVRGLLPGQIGRRVHLGRLQEFGAVRHSAGRGQSRGSRHARAIGSHVQRCPSLPGRMRLRATCRKNGQMRVRGARLCQALTERELRFGRPRATTEHTAQFGRDTCGMRREPVVPDGNGRRLETAVNARRASKTHCSDGCTWHACAHTGPTPPCTPASSVCKHRAT